MFKELPRQPYKKLRVPVLSALLFGVSLGTVAVLLLLLVDAFIYSFGLIDWLTLSS